MSLVFRGVILDEDDIRLLDHARDLAAAGSRHVSTITVTDGEIRDCSCFLCQEN